MMKRRGLQILMMLVLICTLGISACKKDVGTPEDNAVTEPEEEEGEEEAEEESYVIGFSAIDMENPYFKEYTVKKGDNVYEISKKKIFWANT